MRLPFLALILATTSLLPACSGGSDPAPARVAPAMSPKAAPPAAEKRSGRDTLPPKIANALLLPDEPTVDDDLRVELDWAEKGSAYTSVSFEWTVNGSRIAGQSKDTLSAGRGFFKRGDRVGVEVTVTDETDWVHKRKSNEKIIINSPPEITTDPSHARGLQGIRLAAKDADGDSISWSVKEGPPGISIDPIGKIYVQRMALAEAFDGEVVFVASDPQGGRSELHVPVKVNAAVKEVRKNRRITEQTAMESMNDEQYAKAVEKDVARVSNMTAEEFEAYVKDREAREK